MAERALKARSASCLSRRSSNRGAPRARNKVLYCSIRSIVAGGNLRPMNLSMAVSISRRSEVKSCAASGRTPVYTTDTRSPARRDVRRNGAPPASRGRVAPIDVQIVEHEDENAARPGSTIRGHVGQRERRVVGGASPRSDRNAHSSESDDLLTTAVLEYLDFRRSRSITGLPRDRSRASRSRSHPHASERRGSAFTAAPTG